jgi:hypothetical protein
MKLKDNLISALVSPPVRWVNFMHLNRGIAPIVFYRLAVDVHNGKVKTKVDSSIQGRIAYYDPGSNTVIASSHDFGSTYWDEKALLIHESAHAILDTIYAGKDMYGKKAPMKVVDDEIMGYLAGALYLVAAKAGGPSQSGPEREALKIARSKLNPDQPWDGCLTFKFTPSELQPLRAAISSDPMYRSDANRTATHDG